MKMEHEDRNGQTVPFVPHHGHWQPEAPGYHPHHHSTPPDYGVMYSYAEGGYGGHSSARQAHHQQLHPLVVPQWPSLLASQTPYTPYPHSSSGVMHQLGPAVNPMSHPASAPPQVPPQTPKAHTPNPRKTLTEADRRKMCQYHEENPTKKQTEIGVLFGVERSTVSKVLRQKDRYLEPSDGNKSPVKKPKSKFPDIERALTNWIKNQDTRGHKLTDDKIRDQARIFFSATQGGVDTPVNVDHPKWLVEFKRRNNIGGLRSRKSSVRLQKSSSTLSPPPQEATVSPASIAPGDARVVDASATGESPQIPHQHPSNNYTIYHSQSNTSLSSAFATEGTPPTVFTADNTPADSPFYNQDTLHGDIKHAPTLFSSMQATGTSMKRSRSQNFSTGPGPASGGYVSPPNSSQTGTPKFGPLGITSSSTAEMPPPTTIPSRSEQYHQHQYHQTQILERSPKLHEQHNQHSNFSLSEHVHQQSPSLHSNSHPTPQQQTPPQSQVQAQQQIRSNGNVFPPATDSSPPMNSASQTLSPASSVTPSAQHFKLSPTQPQPRPSQEEARVALETVMQYFQNQSMGSTTGSGISVEPQEYVVIGKLIEKLRMHTPKPTPSMSNAHVNTSAMQTSEYC